jgi:hypothetical protein
VGGGIGKLESMVILADGRVLLTRDFPQLPRDR